MQNYRNHQNPFFYFHYDGDDSFSDALFADYVVGRLGDFEAIAPRMSEDVKSVEDIYVVLWSVSFLSLLQNLDRYSFEASIKARLFNLSQKIKVPDKSFVVFVNANYESIFNPVNHENYNWEDFLPYVLRLSFNRYAQGLHSSVRAFLERRFSLHILSDFSSFAGYFSRHTDELNTLFSNLKDTRLFDDRIYLDFLLAFHDVNNSIVRDSAEFICVRTLRGIKEMGLSADNEQLLWVQSLFRQYMKLADRYHLVCFQDYLSVERDIKQLLDEFVLKHGQKASFGPIDLSPAITFLRENNSLSKFLVLTHTRKGDSWVNCFDPVLKPEEKRSLYEMVGDISRNRSNKYSYVKQDHMRLNLWLRSALVNLVLNDPDLSREFGDYLVSVCAKIQEHYFQLAINLTEETSGYIGCLLALIDLGRRKQFDVPMVKAMLVGTSCAICATIEKILRNVAIVAGNHKTFFDPSRTTLAVLLNEKLVKLDDVSPGLKYFIEFYLIQEVNWTGHQIDKPGLNIRNNLMHGQGDVYERTDYGTLLNLFTFLVSLIDDLFVAVDTRNEDL